MESTMSWTNERDFLMQFTEPEATMTQRGPSQQHITPESGHVEDGNGHGGHQSLVQTAPIDSLSSLLSGMTLTGSPTGRSSSFVRRAELMRNFIRVLDLTKPPLDIFNNLLTLYPKWLPPPVIFTTNFAPDKKMFISLIRIQHLASHSAMDLNALESRRLVAHQAYNYMADLAFALTNARFVYLPNRRPNQRPYSVLEQIFGGQQRYLLKSGTARQSEHRYRASIQLVNFKSFDGFGGSAEEAEDLAAVKALDYIREFVLLM